jgi:hypothetical protein
LEITEEAQHLTGPLHWAVAVAEHGEQETAATPELRQAVAPVEQFPEGQQPNRLRLHWPEVLVMAIQAAGAFTLALFYLLAAVAVPVAAERLVALMAVLAVLVE